MSSPRGLANREFTPVAGSSAENLVYRGNTKRAVAEASHDQISVRRRSKRLKPEAHTAQAEDVDEGEKVEKPPSRSGVSKKRTQNAAAVSLEAEAEDEEIEQSTNAIHIRKKQGPEKAEEKPAAGKKTKRKTKAEKEAEMPPLAPRATGTRMLVGAHVSAAKGVFNAVKNSTHVGGNAFALFLKSQRKWDNPPLQDDHADEFRRRCADYKYDASKHILPHGSYLVNLAQEDKAKAAQAYNSFLDDLRRCEALGITLYNFHPGSANQTPHADALSRLAHALTNALSATKTVVPVLETMCGHGTTIGDSLHEFRDLLALIPAEHRSRVGICIDTCHSFSAGYDLVSPAGFRGFMDDFDRLVGTRYLRALHLNDSKAPHGSRRDLHANIGTGFLGLRAFHNVMNEPRFEGLPLILETPIDRPVSAVGEGSADRGGDSDHDHDHDHDSEGNKTKKTKAKKTPAAKQQTVSDPSVWAREIKLLESLVGMDPDGDEFRRLEAGLAEEGREMRQKHLEQYERKLEAEEKKKNKAMKGQKNLVDMMNGSGRKSSRKRKASSGGE
ncbi:lyase [Aspergillus sp. HF37]|nr:lyase [Aspergillus sp. HF37]